MIIFWSLSLTLSLACLLGLELPLSGSVSYEFPILFRTFILLCFFFLPVMLAFADKLLEFTDTLCVFAYGSFFLEALGFLPVEVTDFEEN